MRVAVQIRSRWKQHPPGQVHTCAFQHGPRNKMWICDALTFRFPFILCSTTERVIHHHDSPHQQNLERQTATGKGQGREATKRGWIRTRGLERSHHCKHRSRQGCIHILFDSHIIWKRGIIPRPTQRHIHPASPWHARHLLWVLISSQEERDDILPGSPWAQKPLPVSHIASISASHMYSTSIHHALILSFFSQSLLQAKKKDIKKHTNIVNEVRNREKWVDGFR